MTDVCMKMCSEPIVWLSAHLHAHVRYSGHCTFTCTWCVHVNAQWSYCLMCSIIGQWAQWLMCAWKCAVSQLSDSLHIYMHTSDTRVTSRLHALYVCMHVNVHWSDCPMCSCKWGVSRVTEMCMKMCSEPSVWLSAHLHAHVRHSGHCTFTCTWFVHVNVQWFECLMCSSKWAVSPMAGVSMKMCTEQFVWLSAHLYAHVRHTCHCTFDACM